MLLSRSQIDWYNFFIIHVIVINIDICINRFLQRFIFINISLLHHYCLPCKDWRMRKILKSSNIWSSQWSDDLVFLEISSHIKFCKFLLQSSRKNVFLKFPPTENFIFLKFIFDVKLVSNLSQMPFVIWGHLLSLAKSIFHKNDDDEDGSGIYNWWSLKKNR